MSATTASGATSATSGCVSVAARTTAWYGFSGRAGVGKTWYSGAGANRIPAASTCSVHRRQVCSTTSCPRAARSDRRGRQLGDLPQLREAPLEVERHRRDLERAHARLAVHGEPVAHDL